jgi:hypothetical protein
MAASLLQQLQLSDVQAQLCPSMQLVQDDGGQQISNGVLLLPGSRSPTKRTTPNRTVNSSEWQSSQQSA